MKGIVIAAGYGTRFLPATKTLAKEMFPLVDTPAIDFIVREFIDSGINEILIVTSRRKKILEDYFDREIELETIFTKENDTKKLAQINNCNANIYFVRQREMLGTGHAILICKEFVGKESFVIAYPDDLIFGDVPLSKQLIDVHEKTGGSVLAVQEIEGDVSRYGVVGCTNYQDFYKVTKIVEKPKAGTEPSKMISIGRYLFTSELMDLLEEEFKNHQKGEFYHIGSINKLAASGKMFATKYSGDRIDVGDKLGYIEGFIKYALSRNDIKEGTLEILKKYSV